MSFWAEPVPQPWPLDEDPSATTWWEGLHPALQARWAPLLARLDARGRAHFQKLRREIRDGFKAAEGTPEREDEGDVAEVALYERVAKGVMKLSVPMASGLPSTQADRQGSGLGRP